MSFLGEILCRRAYDESIQIFIEVIKFFSDGNDQLFSFPSIHPFSIAIRSKASRKHKKQLKSKTFRSISHQDLCYPDSAAALSY